MIQITLPDGSKRDYPGPVTVAEVAASIGSGLAKAALAGKVGPVDAPDSAGKVVDTSYLMSADSALSIITAATMKLYPQPAAQLTAWAAVPSLDHAVTLLYPTA